MTERHLGGHTCQDVPEPSSNWNRVGNSPDEFFAGPASVREVPSPDGFADSESG